MFLVLCDVIESLGFQIMRAAVLAAAHRGFVFGVAAVRQPLFQVILGLHWSDLRGCAGSLR
jgi:hypothetical protein